MILDDFKHKAAIQLQIALHVGEYLRQISPKVGEQLEKNQGPWHPTQLCGDYVINHGVIGSLLNNQDSMESKFFFRGSFGFPARWFCRWKHPLLLRHHDRRHDQPNVRGNSGVGKSMEIWWWKLSVNLWLDRWKTRKNELTWLICVFQYPQG